jgi:MFS family permease
MIVGAYGYAYFSPTIISQLGYTAVRANLLSTPPWAVAFVFAMTIATISDYVAHRFLFAITCIIIAMIGFIVLLVPDMRNSVYYGALFLAAPGAYTAMPIIVCWFNTNLGGHLKRSVGSAWQVGFGNIGGIIAVYVFLPATAPRFVLGKSVCIGFFGLAIISTVIYYFGCAWENRRRDRRVGRTDLSEEEMSRLGDSHPDFRFML